MMNIVANILSLGHSGSTLLGNVIGSHSKAMHIGEIVAPLKRKQDLTCQFCEDRPCPLWGTVLESDFMNMMFIDFNQYYRCNRYLRSIKKRMGLWKYGRIYERIFSAFRDIDIIIDCSKNIRWTEYNRNNRRHATKFIFLQRDLRAVWASYIRKYGAAQHGYGYLHTMISHVNYMRNYAATLPDNDCFEIKYEDLASDSGRQITDLCSFLNIETEPDMHEYYKKEHHVLGANFNTMLQNKHGVKQDVSTHLNQMKDADKGYYKDAKSGIVIDNRWTEELDDEALSFFEKHAGDLNRRLGYS